MNKKSILIACLIFVLGIGLMVYVALNTSCTVSVDRSFDASPERIWKIWIDPEMMKHWWGPKNYTAPVIQNDVRLDGRFLFSMKSSEGKQNWNAGHYIEVVPFQKLVYLMYFSDDKGKMIQASDIGIPGQWPDEIKVSVEFKESGGQTTISVVEEGIPTILYFFAKMGWNQQFDKLESLSK